MISVIIPVYNVFPYLKRCLDSVINQTYEDLEIIIIDDGSTDGSEIICDEYKNKDKRIRVFHQENQGLSAARNVGLNNANGEWIAFLDSDDWIEKNMLSTLVGIAEKYNADICSCQTRRIIDGIPEEIEFDKKIREFTFEESIEGLLTQKYIRFEVWNKLWRKELINTTRFIKGQVAEDVYFDFQVFKKANKIVHIDVPLHNYVVNRPGSTYSSFKIARIGVFIVFDDFMDEMLSRGNTRIYEMTACMGASFAISIYKEAVRTKQNEEMKKHLYALFKKYYRVPNAKKYRSIKGRINWALFNISPQLNENVIKVIKKLSPSTKAD